MTKSRDQEQTNGKPEVVMTPSPFSYREPQGHDNLLGVCWQIHHYGQYANFHYMCQDISFFFHRVCKLPHRHIISIVVNYLRAAIKNEKPKKDNHEKKVTKLPAAVLLIA